jgi:hypothetical protein
MEESKTWLAKLAISLNWREKFDVEGLIERAKIADVAGGFCRRTRHSLPSILGIKMHNQ